MNPRYFLLLLAMFSFSRLLAGPPTEEGRTIFTTRCASCHNVHKMLTGPALAGVHERRSMDWIVSFVQSSQTMVKNGDKDAVAVFEQFNKIPMPDHPDLTEQNIRNIVEFIKAEGATASEEKAPFAKPSKIRPHYQPLSINNYGFFLTYLGVIGLLVISLLFLVRLKEYQRSSGDKSED